MNESTTSANLISVLHPRVQKVSEMMAADLQRLRSISALAEDVNLSTRQLERLFQEELGCTPTAYWHQLRMAKAAELLVTSFASIKEVAAQVGITSVSYFVREFKRMYGCSPSEYRLRSEKQPVVGNEQ